MGGGQLPIQINVRGADLSRLQAIDPNNAVSITRTNGTATLVRGAGNTQGDLPENALLRDEIERVFGDSVQWLRRV